MLRPKLGENYREVVRATFAGAEAVRLLQDRSHPGMASIDAMSLLLCIHFDVES